MLDKKAFHYISWNAPIPWKKETRRHNVICIVRHRQKDAYMVLKRTSLHWTSFIMWGVDGQPLLEAWKREIMEETGYTDMTYIKTLNTGLHAEYFAAHKDVNRYSIEHGVVFHLKSDKQHNEKLDDEHHDLIRVDKGNVEETLQDIPWEHSSNLALWYEYLWDEKKLSDYLDRFDRVDRVDSV